MRPRLEEYVRPSRPRADDEAAGRGQAFSGPGRDLLRVLEPDPTSGRVADLPPRDRKRYEARVAEVIARVRRELEEYQAVLEAEVAQRARPRRGKGSGTRGGHDAG